MPAETNNHSLIEGVVRHFQSSWKSLVLTDIAYKVIAFVVLTPLAGVLFRSLLAISGRAVMSDLDILYFVVGPVGSICVIIVGALWLGIVALEQASLMEILWAKRTGMNLGPIAVLRFASSHAWPVLRVTIRVVALTLLTIAPFLIIAAAIYWALLTEYDINYYLKETPTVFKVAVGAGVIIASALVGLLLWLFTSWFFALPLVLFEKVEASKALKLSAERADGHRLLLLCWIVGWLAATAVLAGLATGVVGLVGRVLTPDSAESLHLLAVTVGITLLLWTIVNLAVNLLSWTTFAAILFTFYEQVGGARFADDLPADFAAEPMGAASFRFTRNRVLAGSITGIAIAIGIGVAALHSVQLQDDVKIMAHRGSSKAAPENTMAAFSKAIEEGADWIELDVQETADGEVVVFHDSDFMKLAGNRLKIWDATMDDLENIDIGSWFAPEFKDERVPTLAEVLDECKGRVGVNIELKYYGHDEELEQRVADIVAARGMASDVVAMSLKMDGVKKMKSIRPNWVVGLLMSVSAGNLKKIDADFLAVNAKSANRWLIRAAHENGKEVYVWTVNDAPTMSAMISRGVDGLLTDKPALARSVLEQRSQMSVAERLLLEFASILGTEPEISEQ